jgi:hypothetical protein
VKPVVAVIAPGSMGAAVGQRLTEHGVEVRTSLAGRSAATAARADVAEALGAELAQSQPFLLKTFARSVPGMFPKAYRWIAEMLEIADFSGDPATAELYRGIAGLYRRLTADVAGPNRDTAALRDFLKRAIE